MVKQKLPLRNNRPTTPQTGGKAATGSIIFSDDEPELIVDRINAPFLGVVDGVVEIIENSIPKGKRMFL